jgi:hypothetical protein
MGRHFFERLERWEKGLQVIVVLLFSLLVFFQMFMGKEPIRFYLSFAEQMEGVPLSSQDLAVTSLRQKEVGEVKLKIDSYFILPGAAVYINGKKAAGFQEREVLLPVKAGDEIVLDGTAYPYPKKPFIHAPATDLGVNTSIQSQKIFVLNISSLFFHKTVANKQQD